MAYLYIGSRAIADLRITLRIVVGTIFDISIDMSSFANKRLVNLKRDWRAPFELVMQNLAQVNFVC